MDSSGNAGATTLRNVQGLRAIAALMVVIAHVSGPEGFEERYFGGSWTTWANLPGTTGVDLFFVISGLIMTVTTWRSFDMPGGPRRFLWRRVTRIYPLYWLITTPILLLVLVSPGSVNWDAGNPSDIVASYLLLPQDGRKLLLVGWTLVYEMYFYLLFALAMWLGRRWFGWVIGAWGLLTVTLHVAVDSPGNPYVSLVSSLLSVEFVFGVVIGYAVVRGWLRLPRAVLAVGVAAVAGVLAYVGASGWTAFPSETVRVLGPGLAMAVVVYAAVALEVRRNVIAPRFLQRWGDASYSMYLIHVPVLTAVGAVLVKLVTPNSVLHTIGIVAAPAFMIMVALICYRVIENPLHQFFRRAQVGRTNSPVVLDPKNHKVGVAE
jgi:peptidoglycan/LPS O-acetylase OafA/YrhL